MPLPRHREKKLLSASSPSTAAATATASPSIASPAAVIAPGLTTAAAPEASLLSLLLFADNINDLVWYSEEFDLLSGFAHLVRTSECGGDVAQYRAHKRERLW
jgi:hypothetical protein